MAMPSNKIGAKERLYKKHTFEQCAARVALGRAPPLCTEIARAIFGALSTAIPTLRLRPDTFFMKPTKCA
jgi:hypothetical protein